jgi:hypothetical protein
MQIKKEYARAGIPIWQSKNTQVAQGGFLLHDAAFSTEGTVVPAGIPIGFDEATRKAKVGKFAVMQATATASATDYKILKGHKLKVGMALTTTGASGAQNITEITTTAQDYDVVKLSATLGVALSVGDALFVNDEGFTQLKGLLYEDVIIDSNGIADVAVVLHGTVYARRIVPVPDAIQAKLPLIIFSQSY